MKKSSQEKRITKRNTFEVLESVLNHISKGIIVSHLIEKTNTYSATLYPTLSRLEDAKMVVKENKKYYITEKGRKFHELLSDFNNPNELRKFSEEEWYCIACGKHYTKYQKTCERCLNDDTIEEGDW